MIYTINFYRVDEVKAALQLCISYKRAKEALFWTLELIESEEDISLKSALFNSWFHNIGLANINILKDIFEIETKTEEEKVFQLVYTMCYTKRDCTLPVIYLYGLSKSQYSSNNISFELPKNLIQENKYLDTFIRSCILGKYLDAWIVSIPLWKNKLTKTVIEQIISYKYKDPIMFEIYLYLINSKNINKWYLRCTLVGIACFAEKYYQAPVEYNSSYTILNDTIKEWKNTSAKRKRRTYAIPKSCLYGRTYRGTLTYHDSNDEELHEPNHIITNQNIYKSVLKKYESIEEFYNDAESYDAFISSYFPDDIPDEWSLIDREKSHGFGINQKCDTPNLFRYFNRWVDLKTECKIWNKEQVVSQSIQIIKDTLNSYYIEDELFYKYDAKAEELSNEKERWNLNSLKLIISALE